MKIAILIPLCVSVVVVSVAAVSSRTARDIRANIAKDDPKSRCRNGGIFSNNGCHCIHPHTGPSCQDFACVHGLSVGWRYDPNSLFFHKPCICNAGWSGDLCEYHLTERCGNRGEWKGGRCECIGSFFGNECQYTSRCDQGSMKHGRCLCNKDWEGEYCHEIVCHHGYPNIKNNSMSCICPLQYKGIHCDECSQSGEKVQPYPKCIVEIIPSNARTSRKKASAQIFSRFVIMVGACSFLFLIAGFMILLHWIHRKRKSPSEEAERIAALNERQAMLQEAAMNAQDPQQLTVQSVKRERKRSLANIFRFKPSFSTAATSTNE